MAAYLWIEPKISRPALFQAMLDEALASPVRRFSVVGADGMALRNAGHHQQQAWISVLDEATIADLPAIRRVLAGAFFPDPMMEWIFPDPEMRPAALAAWLGLFAEGYLLSGRVDVFRFDEIQAVAMWRMPGAKVEFPKAPSVAGLLTALIGRTRTEQIRTALSTIASLTPSPAVCVSPFPCGRRPSPSATASVGRWFHPG